MKIDYDITEPVKAYDYFLKDAVHEAASNYFDGLASKNKVDIDANALTVKELNAQRAKVEETKNKLNGSKGLRTFVIFMTVLFFIAAAIMIVVMIFNFKWWLILIALGLVGVAVGFIFIAKNLKNKIKKACEENLAKYSWPFEYEFRKELPKTLVGKVAFKVLMDEEKAKKEKS